MNEVISGIIPRGFTNIRGIKPYPHLEKCFQFTITIVCHAGYLYYLPHKQLNAWVFLFFFANETTIVHIFFRIEF